MTDEIRDSIAPPAEPGGANVDATAAGSTGPGGAETSRQETESGPADAVPRTELDKVVAQRQAVKEKVRQLAAQLDALRARNEALEGRLGGLLRDQELRRAAAQAGAINPEQVVAMLRDRVRLAATPEGRWTFELPAADGRPAPDGARAVRDVQHLVELFLSQSENANLVRPTVAPGSGARQAGGVAAMTDPMPRTKAEFLALPPDKRLALAHRMTRPQRDALLGRNAAEGGGYL